MRSTALVQRGVGAAAGAQLALQVQRAPLQLGAGPARALQRRHLRTERCTAVVLPPPPHSLHSPWPGGARTAGARRARAGAAAWRRPSTARRPRSPPIALPATSLLEHDGTSSVTYSSKYQVIPISFHKNPLGREK